MESMKRSLLERAKSIDASTPEREQADPIAQAHLLERMKRRFGMGDDPTRRQKFYESVVKIVSERGQVALDCVNQAAAQAVSARQPGRYFAALVKCLFAERGIAFSTVTTSSDW
jgi:hypothetical protein